MLGAEDQGRIELPELAGRSILLRGLTPDDAAAVEELLADPQLAAALSPRAGGERAYSTGRLALSMVLGREESALHAGILTREDRRLVGTVSLQSWDRKEGTATLGYMLKPDCWGQGWAAEAVGLLLNYAQDIWKLRRVEGRCMDSNLRSARVMEKNGMMLARTIPLPGKEGGRINVYVLLHN